MKISILTPSYNQGKYIKRTIESVLTQNIKSLEYIVMDGGSTDETVDILKEYGDKIIWRSEKDEGQADAVNKGLRIATGEIIGWLNSDDIYYPNTLKKILNFFETHPDINVVYGNANHIGEDDSFIEQYYTENFNYERLKDVCYICQPALFFRKSLVEKYGYLDSKLQYCMDYDYWLRLGKNEKFYRIADFVAGSRLYSDNKTIGSRRKVHEEILKMQEKNFGRASQQWIFNLAHVIADEKGIPREKNGTLNSKYARAVALNSAKEFILHYGYIPRSAWIKISTWLLVRDAR